MVKIFVGRLASEVSPAQLQELFEQYGTVSDCDILRDYAFVHMSCEQEAISAIDALDKFDLCGSKLSVEMSTSRSMKSCQLTVKNLPAGVTSQDMHKLFKKFGTVTLCRVQNDKAIVHMRFPSMATNAVRNLNGETFKGNVLLVEFANNFSKNDWVKITNDYPSENTNGIQTTEPDVLPGPKTHVVVSYPSTPATNAWKNVNSFDKTPENLNSVNNNSITKISTSSFISPVQHSVNSSNTAADNNLNPNKVSEYREGRRLRIKQGLQFLQSSMPWSGTKDMYKTFLSQLKEMLLDEAQELNRENRQKDAIIQLNEAINICNYTKKEGISVNQENLEKLLMERASIHLHMRNASAALEDAEKALDISKGLNQVALRCKARILVDMGRRNDALCLMLKLSQVSTFDTESAQLCNILKQSMGVSDEQAMGMMKTKGAIGDGRSRQAMSPNVNNVHKVDSNNLRAPWPNMNGSGDSGTMAAPFSNFGNANSNLLGPGINPFPYDYFNPPKDPPNSQFGGFSPALFDSSRMPARPAQSPFSAGNFPPNNLYSDSLFAPPQLPRPIGFRRPTQNFAPPAGGPMNLWGDGNSNLGGFPASSPPEGGVNDLDDQEITRAIEDELKLGDDGGLAAQTFGKSSRAMWNNTDTNSTSINNGFNGVGNIIGRGSSYTHFPESTFNGGGLGFNSPFLGPAMLGISTSRPTIQTPAQAVAKPEAPQFMPINGPVAPVTSPPAVTSPALEPISDSLSEILRNPLHDTHEFKLGCSECVLRTGPRVVDFRHDEVTAHSCYKNILLCRRRGTADWLKIRPRPQPQSKAQLYDGPYYICKDLMSGQDCTYPAVCTFAYNQEEIDVWTLERKGMLNRQWLCKSMDINYVSKLSLVGLIICKHRGTFDFLCKMCFQNKPRIVSKFSPALGKCTNENTPHRNLPDNQQLTHILRESSVRYTEIRSPTQQAILCRHAIRFQCTRGSDCHFAHSLVERDIWAIMEREGLTSGDIVSQSVEHINKQPVVNGDAVETNTLFTEDNNANLFRWKAKFICSLCHKNGQTSESTKNLKYCTARAQHSWTTNKKVMLVHTAKRQWVQIRDLPYLKNKNLPVRFELCENFRRQKKCSFSGKCNFAHSQEEMDIWMYIRDNQLKDLEELYNTLNKTQTSSKLATTNPIPGLNTDKSNIILPCDILQQSAYHCWLCDKECNGQRQWEKHCLSEKHKLRAISDSDGHWGYRKPGGTYKLCERHEKGVCEFDFLPASDNTCSYAHGKEELEEWTVRRQYIINRIQKAKDDHLIDESEVLLNHSTAQ